jgi:thymidylate kinase
LKSRKKPRPAGRLFVFEGPDGVGKTTLSTLAAGFLTDMGVKADYLSFPGREPDTVGRFVYDLHHAPAARGISATAVQALHVAAHADAIERQIGPRLSDGVNVLLDRFWWSTWVYGVSAGIDRTALRRLIAFEERVWGSITPAAVILVQRKTPLGRPDESLVRWRRLQREYAALATREGKSQAIEFIDNNGEITSSFQRAISIVGSRIRGHQRTVLVREAGKQTFGSSASASPTPSRQQPASVSAIDRSTPTILLHLEPAKPTRILDTYWRFAAERQRVFFGRAEGKTKPWTADPILSEYKFTNAYRASDRVSQYLIRHVIYRDDLPGTADEVFFRILLFKFFNKIETWRLLEEAVGPLVHANYSFDSYERVLDRAMRGGRRIYSAAYIMPTGGRATAEPRKHRLHLRLLERMMADGLPQKLAAANSMHAAFDLFLAYPTIGTFLAYQFVTDINYSGITSFSEREFVVPGPGALDGIKKCFASLGGLSHAEIIKFMMDIQEREFERLGLKFNTLWGRPLQLIDCQNLFCEVDKYSRVAHPEAVGISGRTRIKQRFEENPEPIEYWYPPKWRLNDKILEWTRGLIQQRGQPVPET